MNFLQRWVGRVFRLTDAEPFAAMFGSGTYAGKNVSPQDSLQVSTAWACMKLLSETVGSLPIDIVRNDGDNREKDPLHWSYWLLREQPNREMTPVEFKEALLLNLLSWGNAFIELTKNERSGRTELMRPLLSELMQPERIDANTIVYKYHTENGILVYPQERIMHIKGFGFNGLMGLSPIAFNRQSLGIAMAAEEFAGRFYKTGMRSSGILVAPQSLTPEQRRKLRERFEEFQEGVEESHKLMILEAAFDFKPLTIPPDHAQFLETRKYEELEICRIFLVPPHMVQNLERATFSNIESQDLQFGKYTLRPYLIRLEQGLKRSLLLPAERRQYSYEFNMNAIFRADLAARASFYSTMVQNGIMTRNEVRALENLNAQDGGDELTVQSNMIDLDELISVANRAESFKQLMGEVEKMEQAA